MCGIFINMKKISLFTIFILILVLFTLGLIKFGPDFTGPKNEFVDNTLAPVEESTPKSLFEQGETYSIKVDYPDIQDRDVSIYIDDAVASFKVLVAPVPVGLSSGEYVLDINYSVMESTKTETYIIKNYTYTGGAHGFEDTKTFSYLKDTEERITLDDLFKKDGYIPALSQVVKDAVLDLLGEDANVDMVETGTSQAIENFERFYLKDNSIVFIFPPYAVAPYSEGTVMVEIPVSTLGGMVDLDYFSI